MLDILYSTMPENTKAAVQQGLKFLNGGKDNGEEKEEMQVKPRIYSFAKDSDFIYSAFKQTHNIDLSTEQLHWWKFIALFMDLGPDTTFCNLINLRKKVKTGKATKEENEIAHEMGDAFEIPEFDTRTLEEKEIEMNFMNQINSATRYEEGQK